MVATSPEDDRLEVRAIRSGKTFADWETITIASDFLTPCDTFALESGGELSPVQIMRDLPMGSPVEFLINGTVFMTGQVDLAHTKSTRGGSRLSITGRDFLARIVDSNVDPRMQISKGIDVDGLVKLVMTQFGLLGLVNDNGAKVRPLGKAKGGKAYSAKHKRTDPLKEITPKANQGAYDYLEKILAHAGYHLWAAPTFPNVVVAGPDYDQPTSYSFTKLQGAGSVRNNVLDSDAQVNETNVPSHVYVKGASSKAGTKTGYTAFASQGLTSSVKVVYLDDPEATTKEKAERIARTFLARKMRELMVYNCVVDGFTDRKSGNVYCVDTLGSVDDEVAGVKGTMWVESRTFTRSRSDGTKTVLKLVPPKMLLLDWQPDETIGPPISYEQAAKDANEPGEFERNRIYQFNGVTFFTPRA